LHALLKAFGNDDEMVYLCMHGAAPYH
jgi:hypothetical protein